MRHRHWLIGLSCVWAVGCGGDSEFNAASSSAGQGSGGTGATAGKGAGGTGASGTAGSAAGGIALADLPDAYASAACALLERCAGFLYDLTTAYEDCQLLTAEGVRQNGYDALAQAVSDGRVEYHADLMPACVAAVENRDCAELNNRGIDACESAVMGTAAKGESCELNEECEGSLICETKDACPGTCVDRYTAGTPCSVDDECADGLVCSSATAHCVSPPGEGEPCGGGVEPQCQAGFICSGDKADQMMPGACYAIGNVALGNEGEACDPTNAALCKTGLSCVVTAIVNGALTWECRKPGGSAATCGVGVPEDCQRGEYY